MESSEILLVEDSPEDAELTLRALRKGKLANHIEVLRDGEEALDYLFCLGRFAQRSGADMPRLVLLDIKLPKVDGLEVLRRLKSDSKTRWIPVVMLTSSREQSDLFESYRLGVNSYIVKPVNFDGFAQTIQKLGFYWLSLNQTPFVEEQL